MNNLKDHSVKLILIDLNEKKINHSILSAKGSIKKTGFTTKKYFELKKEERNLEK